MFIIITFTNNLRVEVELENSLKLLSDENGLKLTKIKKLFVIIEFSIHF